MPEWSKGVDSSSTVEKLAGSSPVICKNYLTKASMPERPKGEVLRTFVVILVGSNPTASKKNFLKLRKKREKKMRKEFRKPPV